ncbi:MAG: prolipoprotein diacylglyceryl transferase family protein [Anaerolineae bacterium]
MTLDWTDFADALRWLLALAGVGWLFYAWLYRIAYRRVLLVVLALVVVDWTAQTVAGWAVRPDSNLPTDVPAYSTFILLAAVLGLAFAGWQARRDGIALAAFLDTALVVVLIGGIGARGYHILSHWDYYSQNIDDMTNLAQGGMGMRGALGLGLLALALFAPLRRVSFWKLADAGAVGLSLALAVGWYAARLIGANYGVVSDAPFAQDLPDLYGIVAPRMPVQLAAIGFFFLVFAALAWQGTRPSRRPGALLLLFLILFGLGNLGLDSQRADETLLWNGWRVDQLFDLVFAGLGLIVLGARNIAFRVRPNVQVEAR